MPRRPSPSRTSYRLAKRAMDMVGAAVLIALFSPVMAVVAALVRARMGPPILFRQERPGIGGRPFRILKFRTMLHPLDTEGRPRSECERLTGLGRALRALSLDELPELLNVLRGEMSLVGPRPLLMEYLPLYSALQARRHEVAPGVTGLAQVSGRNAISWEEKFDLDVWYVDHASLGLDLRILAQTLLKVLKREGITPGDQEIMPRFEGSARA